MEKHREGRVEDGSIIGRIAEICEHAGPRGAGTKAEQRAADLVAERMRSFGLEAAVEPFDVQPFALSALIVAVAAMYLLAFGLYFVFPPAALLVLLVQLVTVALQLRRGRSPISWLLSTARSQNVVARLAPAGEPRPVLLFGGHHDSAYRMPLLERSTYRIVMILFPLFVSACLVLLALSAWSTVLVLTGAGASTASNVLYVFIASGAACAVVLPAGLVRTDVVMGANDNLSAVGVLLALAEHFSKEPPRSVELRFVSFGAEESGLVGSRDFVQRHADGLVGSVLVNLESLGQRGSLRVIGFELMTGARHSRTAQELVLEAALRAEIGAMRHWLPAGLTDATSFSRAGIDATTLIRLDSSDYLDHYHNPGDDLPALRKENLAEAFELCKAIVALADERASSIGRAAPE